MAVSAEERQRRSDRARQMHADGRLGNASANGRRGAQARARNVSALAAELVERHARDIERAFSAALREGSPASRAKAADSMLRLALRAESLDVGERRVESESMDRAALLDTLAAKLTSGPAGQALALHLAGHDAETIEGTAQAVPAPRGELPAGSTASRP